MDNHPIPPKLKTLEHLSALMDDRFRLPGTNFRFGLDAILGLIPYAGDLTGFVISGSLITIMLRHGASGKLVVKMLWNILIDSVIGSIPFLGDIFDFTFRANRKNVELLREHYESGEHHGSALPYILGFIFVLILLIAVQLFFLYKALAFLLGLV